MRLLLYLIAKKLLSSVVLFLVNSFYVYFMPFEYNLLDWESNYSFFWGSHSISISIHYFWYSRAFVCVYLPNLFFHAPYQRPKAVKEDWIFSSFCWLIILAFQMLILYHAFTFEVYYFKFWLGDQISFLATPSSMQVIDFAPFYLASLVQDRKHSILKEAHRSLYLIWMLIWFFK